MGVALAFAIVKVVASVASVAYSITSGIKARGDAKDAQRDARALAEERASRRNTKQPIPNRTILYGEVNTGGPFLYIDNPSDKHFVTFIKLASHEVDSFLRFSVNDEAINVPEGGGELVTDEYCIYRYNERGQYVEVEVTKADYDSYPSTGIFVRGEDIYEGKVFKEGRKYKGLMWIYPVTGDGSQNVRELITQDEGGRSFASDDLTDTDRFEGVAGLVVKTYNLSREFPDLSPNWNALVRGRKVLRADGTTSWSNNPAECARDYLESFTDSTLKPLTDDATWQRCIGNCAEIITTKDGLRRPRYMTNGIAISSEERREVLEQLQLSMAGSISYAGDRWHYMAGVWRGVDITYNASEVLREVEVTFEGRSSDVPTAAKAKLISAEHNWSEVESSVQQVGDVDERRVDLDLTLNYVTFQEQAQRICRIEALRARREKTAVLQFGPRGLRVRPGTIGIYTIPMMESAGCDTYEVDLFERKFQITDDRVSYESTHTIRQTGESDYFWDAEIHEGQLTAATNSLSSTRGSSPTNISFSRTDTLPVEGGDDGAVEILVTWEDPLVRDKDILHILVVATLDGDRQTFNAEAGDETAYFSWSTFNDAPVTLSAQAFFDDGTNSGVSLA